MYILHAFVYFHIALNKNANLEVQSQIFKAKCVFKEFVIKIEMMKNLGSDLQKS